LIVVSVDEEKILYIYGEDGAYVDEEDLIIKYCSKCYGKTVCDKIEIYFKCSYCGMVNTYADLIDPSQIKNEDQVKSIFDVIEDGRLFYQKSLNGLNLVIEKILKEKIEMNKEINQLK
jgi:hypothetical protein